MVKPRLRGVVLWGVVAIGCHAPRTDVKRQNASQKMETSGNDKQAWSAAEQLARRELESKGHKIESIDRVPSLPFFFVLGIDDGRGHCLVSEGKVVEAKGVAALGAYLRASGFLRRHSADADNFLELLHHLDAYPPDMATRSMYFDPSHPELNPRLDWAGDGARFVLHYPVSSYGGPSGSRQRADMMDLEEWTLSIPADYHVAWKSRIISVPVQQ